MNSPPHLWRDVTQVSERLSQVLKRWCAIAMQDRETRRTLARARRAYRRYLAERPSGPHLLPGKAPPEVKDCLYLHGLRRRTEEEQARYRSALATLADLDSGDDVLRLAQRLCLAHGARCPPLSCGRAGADPLWRDARKALRSLPARKRTFLRSAGALECTTALVVSLAVAKSRLDRSLRSCRDSAPLRLGLVIPMHEEVARLQPRSASAAGEDCFHRKIKELEFLLASGSDEGPGGRPDLRVTVFFVCDDDATYAELVRLASGLRSTVSVVVHRGEDHLGNSKSSNVRQGFRLAYDDGHDLIGYTDADLSANLGQIGFLISQILDDDLGGAIGSRGLPGSWIFGRERLRLQQSQLYNFLVKVLVGLPFEDTQLGLKVFTRSVARELLANAFRDPSMAFDTELLLCAQERHLRVREVPVVWFESALESKSSSLRTALEMLSHLLRQARKPHDSGRREAGVALLSSEPRLREALLDLGMDPELNTLIGFCSRYYDLIEPIELRELGGRLRSLLQALVSGALSEGELREFLESCLQLLLLSLRSRRLAFWLHRYPQIPKILSALWQQPGLLKPILCFLLGSAAVAKVLPDVGAGIPSFHAFLRAAGVPPSRRDLVSDAYQEWLEMYLRGPGPPHPRGLERPARDLFRTAMRSRLARARDILAAGVGRGQTLHIIIPAMGARSSGQASWSDQDRQSTVRELSHLSEKVLSVQELFAGVAPSHRPCFHFHVMTGLPSSLLSDERNAGVMAAALSPLGNRIPEGCAIAFYTVDESSSRSVSRLQSHRLAAGGDLLPDLSVTVTHRLGDPSRELAEPGMRKGTLLRLGFKVVLRLLPDAERRSAVPSSWIGYTVATSKIPLTESLVLLRALTNPDATNPCRLALGSRRLPESELRQRPLLHHLRSALLNVLTRGIFPDLAALHDTQASCKLMTPAMAAAIFEERDDDEAAPVAYGSGLECDVEMLQVARLHGGELHEEAIAFHEDEGARDELGLGVGTDLLLALLALRRRLPDVAQRPLLARPSPTPYTAQWIGGGSEHSVFKLVNQATRESVAVKIPHEALDAELFLRLESLCVHRLRDAGLSRVTGRLDQRGLFAHAEPVQTMLATRNPRAREAFDHLRHWPAFNSFLLKVIRCYEGKTFKSSGYPRSQGARGFVSPFRFLSGDEVVRIPVHGAAPAGAPVELVFDGLDHVIVARFVEDSLETYLERRCGELLASGDGRADEIAEVVGSCVTVAYRFEIELAQRALLYDLDMNLWADLGLESPGARLLVESVRLLDPGEVESLASAEDRHRSKCVLYDRLGIPVGDGQIDAASNTRLLRRAIEDLDYGSRVFRSFQFSQLEIVMDRYGLGEARKARARDLCVTRVRDYLRVLFEISFHAGDLAASPRADREDPFDAGWCIFDKTEEDRRTLERRFRRQVASLTLGGEVQGSFRGGSAAAIGRALEDFSIPVASRGIAVRKTGSRVGKDPPSPGSVPAPVAPMDLLVLNRRQVDLFQEGAALRGRPTRSWNPRPDPQGIPYRSAVAPLVHTLATSASDGCAVPPPAVAILNAGIGTRMSLLSWAEGSKGGVCVDGTRLWEGAAVRYGALAREIRRAGRRNLIVVGAADTWIEAGSDSRFAREVASFLSSRDPAHGRQPGILLLQLPTHGGDDRVAFPYSRRDQLRRVRDRFPELLQELQSVVPGLSVLRPWRREDRPAPGTGSAGRRGGAATRSLPPLLVEARRALGGLQGLDLISEGIGRWGGLRLPFLIILQRSVLDEMNRQFFAGLSAREAESLSWFNTLALGLSPLSQKDFIGLHSRRLAVGRARALHRLLRSLRRRFLGPFHARRMLEIASRFCDEMDRGQIAWRSFESPMDVFDFYRSSRVPEVRRIGGQVVKVYRDRTAGPSESLAITLSASCLEPGAFCRELAVVIAGDVEPQRLTLELHPPASEVARRSNLYPYLVYCAAQAAGGSDRPLRLPLAAQEVCALAAGGEIVKAQLAHLTRRAILAEPVSVWNGESWTAGGATLGDLDPPAGDRCLVL